VLALAVAAAWTYTGGPWPYGYYALGEVSVFLFFGLVAVLGTAYVQTRAVPGPGLAVAVAMGSFASAILVANNLRDVASDGRAGKRTLAVVLGVRRTQAVFGGLLTLPLVAAATPPSYGAGMRICPDAELNDGLLDVTVVGPLSRTALLRLYPTVRSGAHVRHPAVTTRQAQAVTLAVAGVGGCADGERLGPPPLRNECRAGALRVLAPAGSHRT
jgi:hypothetical protein